MNLVHLQKDLVDLQIAFSSKCAKCPSPPERTVDLDSDLEIAPTSALAKLTDKFEWC
jgi:hypothetical protein